MDFSSLSNIFRNLGSATTGLLKEGTKNAIKDLPGTIMRSGVNTIQNKIMNGLAGDDDPTNDYMGGEREGTSNPNNFNQFSENGKIQPNKIKSASQIVKKRDLERSPEFVENQTAIREADAERSKSNKQVDAVSGIETQVQAQVSANYVKPNGDLNTISRQLDSLNRNMVAGDKAFMDIEKAENDIISKVAAEKMADLNTMRAAQLSANAQLVASEQMDRQIATEGSNNVVDAINGLKDKLGQQIPNITEPQRIGAFEVGMLMLGSLANRIYSFFANTDTTDKGIDELKFENKESDIITNDGLEIQSRNGVFKSSGTGQAEYKSTIHSQNKKTKAKENLINFTKSSNFESPSGLFDKVWSHMPLVDTAKSRAENMFDPKRVIEYFIGINNDYDETFPADFTNQIRRTNLSVLYKIVETHNDLINKATYKINLLAKGRTKDLTDSPVVLRSYNNQYRDQAYKDAWNAILLCDAFNTTVPGKIDSVKELNESFNEIMDIYKKQIFYLMSIIGVSIENGKLYANNGIELQPNVKSVEHKSDKYTTLKINDINEHFSANLSSKEMIENRTPTANSKVNLSDLTWLEGDVLNISNKGTYDYNGKTLGDGYTGTTHYWLDHSIQGSNKLTSNYGEYRNHGKDKVHHGIDLGLTDEMKKDGGIKSICDGEVVASGPGKNGEGFIIVKDKYGNQYKNVHVENYLKPGTKVKKGQTIGKINSDHLHLEMKEFDASSGKLIEVNPLNSLIEDGEIVKKATGTTKTNIGSSSNKSSGNNISSDSSIPAATQATPAAVSGDSTTNASKNEQAMIYAPNNVSNSGNVTNNTTIINIVSDQAKAVDLT